ALAPPAQIAGPEPTAAEGPRGGALVAPVAGGDHGAAHLALAGGRDPDGTARQRPSHAAGPQRVRGVDRDGRARLCEAVSLEDVHPDAVEEVGESLTEGGSAG